MKKITHKNRPTPARASHSTGIVDWTKRPRLPAGRLFASVRNMCHSRWFASLALLSLFLSPVVILAADPEDKLRPYDGSQGYFVFPGTTSPDGAWAVVFASSGLKPEEQAALKEWPADLRLDGDDFDNYLLDLRKKRLAGALPAFDYFNGHGWHKNRASLYVAWAPDSRHALAISEERWDDAAIVWLDATAQKFPSVKEPMERAYGAWLRAHEKHPIVAAMTFQNPVALGADVVAVEAWSQLPKAEDYAHWRLKMRFTPGKEDSVRCEIVAGVRVPKNEEVLNLEQEESLQVIYDRLRAKLSGKARETLKQEQLAWLKVREALPEEEQDKATAYRAALLRARVDFP